jgi:hypothetical protein
MGRPKKNPKPAVIEPEDESQDFEEQEALEATEPDEEPADTPSKSQAARAAMDEGYEKPGEAGAWIKKTYGIDMGPQHFSAIKSQMKKAEFDAPKTKPGRKPRAIENGYLASPPKRRIEPDRRGRFDRRAGEAEATHRPAGGREDQAAGRPVGLIPPSVAQEALCCWRCAFIVGSFTSQASLNRARVQMTQ